MKTLVCPCEDITLDDVEHAIADGLDCFEDLKRFLGLATGPCQGKSCVATTLALLSERTGVPLKDLDLMTFRPPVRPIPFATLAAGDA